MEFGLLAMPKPVSQNPYGNLPNGLLAPGMLTQKQLEELRLKMLEAQKVKPLIQTTGVRG